MRRTILLRPLQDTTERGNIGTWDEFPWDGTSNMETLVTNRYPQAFTSTTYTMEALLPLYRNGQPTTVRQRLLVATVRTYPNG